MKSVGLLILTGLSALTFGCAEVRVHRRSAHVELSDRHEEGYNAVVFGLKSLSDPVDLRARCGKQDWEVITSRKKPLQALLSVVTLNLYSPWTAETECLKPEGKP